MQHNPYNPGHPWYYVLGGPVLLPSEICLAVKQSGYTGYRTDIEETDKKGEPYRSAELRCIRDDVLMSFWQDISRYRKVVRSLHYYRKTAEPLQEQPKCADIYVSVSLKHNHLYNDFAHLLRLDELLSRQLDLFDL
jgi:hypothetical protein